MKAVKQFYLCICVFFKETSDIQLQHFNHFTILWILSGTTQVSRYQKGETRKVKSRFTEARDSEWQGHLLSHMQICTLPLTDYCHVVCRNINEDKRKAEGHQVMFEIINDIENCPVCIFVVDGNCILFILLNLLMVLCFSSVKYMLRV